MAKDIYDVIIIFLHLLFIFLFFLTSFLGVIYLFIYLLIHDLNNCLLVIY